MLVITSTSYVSFIYNLISLELSLKCIILNFQNKSLFIYVCLMITIDWQLDRTWNHQGNKSLILSVRKCLGRVNESRKTPLKCGCTIPLLGSWNAYNSKQESRLSVSTLSLHFPDVRQCDLVPHAPIATFFCHDG